MVRVTSLFSLGALFFFMTSSSFAQTRYKLVDLGDFPGGYDASSATAISSDGRICGVGTIVSNRVHQLYWDSTSGRIDLGTINNIPGFSYAYGVNSNGTVVGENWANGAMLPSIWETGAGIQALPGLSSGGGIASAVAINDAGQIAGSSLTDADYHAVRWNTPNSIEDLGVVGTDTSSRSNGIGPDGRVVGFSKGSSEQAFLWSSEGGMTVIGQLQAGVDCEAWSINAAGQVVGTSYGAINRAFLWTSASGMVDLGDGPNGAQSMIAYSINDGGDVVGTYSDLTGSHGYIWSSSIGAQDLTTLLTSNTGSWTVFNAAAINNKGWIAASAKTPSNTRGHAVLLKPVYFLHPTAFDISIGSLKSGSLGDLSQDDNVAVQICKAFVPNFNSPFVRVTASTPVPITVASTVRFSVRSKMSHAGSFRQDISLWDSVANSYTDLRQDTLGLNYSTIEVQASAPGNLIDVNSNVTARIEIRRTGFASVAVPCAEFDAVTWQIEE